ncbi:MAG: hypothetical protein U9N32_03030 [Spirochaetota bacterium]|nr:hypothetical protein [Spirochaetota bacterium]
MADSLVAYEHGLEKAPINRSFLENLYGRPYINNIVESDKKRIAQKEKISRVRKNMVDRAKDLPADEINWISEMVAELPLEKWTVEQSAPGVWFFKFLLAGNWRVNLQVDREYDAFFSVYKNGQSAGAAYGNLRQTVNDIKRIVVQK